MPPISSDYVPKQSGLLEIVVFAWWYSSKGDPFETTPFLLPSILNYSKMNPEEKKEEVFQEVESQLTEKNIKIKSQDNNRPWGGFFVIEEDEAQKFADEYFDGMDTNELKISGKLSPKILIVAPHKRLSWQYHHRRAEIWEVIKGEVGVVRSNTDVEGELVTHKPGDLIKLKQGERHRLVGLDNWGIVSEIWQHTDPENPSDEDDIVRVQDDFGR